MTRGRPKHPDILTPREWQVLDLLREGLTNEQIANRLGISDHGAKYHVLEILSKLGVSSRYEAAAWQREPATASRHYAGLVAILAWRPSGLSALSTKVLASTLVVAAFGFMGLLAVGVLVMNQRSSGATVAPDASSEPIAAAAPGTATPTPTPDETATSTAIEAATRGLSSPAGLSATPPPQSSTAQFMTQLPASALQAISDFAASEGSSYAGPCSLSTQPGQLCMTNVEVDPNVTTIQAELRVSGQSLAYGLTLASSGSNSFQIVAANGPVAAP